MSDLRSPLLPAGADPVPSATPPPRAAGLSPLLVVLSPLVVTAIVLGFVFSRYFSSSAAFRQAVPGRFLDVTEAAGLRFTHGPGGMTREDTPSTLSGGVAVIDYDHDGAPDLFFTNAVAWPWSDSDAPAPACALFRNDGTGKFVDVTGEAGLALRLQGMGVAVADFDNDGWSDLFITAVGGNKLLRNRGDGTFVDVTERAGVGADANTWSTGAVWLDLDADGRLDLIVCHYARWPREIELDVAFKIAGVGRSYGAPAGFVAASPGVYRNRGDGVFEEATERFGFRNLSPDTRLPRAEVLGVAPVDSNGDGLLDVLFFYHNGEPTLYLNQGGGRFAEFIQAGERQEGSAASLLALGALPRSRGRETPNALEVLRAVEATSGTGGTVAPVLRMPSKLGVALLDYDLDGRVDLFSGGGRAEPGLNRFDAGRAFAAAPSLYWNYGDGWIAASPGAEAEWAEERWIRGMAVADYDGDGDEDIVLAQHGGAPKLLRNEQRARAAWLKVRLEGTRSPRDGTGARVEVHTPRQKLTRWAAPAVGFLSQSDSTLTFGLGEDARVRRLVVLWPSGLRQEVSPVGINRVVRVVENDQ